MERVKIDLEFVIKSSPTILFQYLSTPSGLVEWFCDDVNIKGSKQYTFVWDGEDNPAELVKKVNGKLLLLIAVVNYCCCCWAPHTLVSILPVVFARSSILMRAKWGRGIRSLVS